MSQDVFPGHSAWGQRALAAYGAAVLVFLMLPTLIVVPMSFSDSQYLEFPPQSWSLRWYRVYFGSDAWMDATRTSLVAAVLVTVLSTPVGTVAAYGMHCGTARLRDAVQLLVLLPVVVPTVLVAVGVFHLYAILDLNYTLAGVVLAHTALAVPFVVISVLASLRNYDMTQEMAARSMGASRTRAFLTITLPQIRFSVLTGAFLAFITSLDEVVVAMFVSGGENATITRRMFNSLRDQIDPTIAAISTCLIVVSVAALACVQLIGGRARRAG
jgi:putative spermidine/putrescine transport system permease protein